ncbi:MAG: glycosyltransferase [Candidatus Nanoarchaeia archaeon]|nr:glycosyltransferase [Candidatus Nanoarchaeia archaeon]MDD5499674.1 glycosyltransferase [Candidatus Nanoarchaeia archaeon]
MKLAIFTDSFRPNLDGVATVTHLLAKEMVKKGHKVTIVCPGDNSESGIQYGFKVIRLKSYSIKLTDLMKICFKSPGYVEKLEDFSKYDLVHLQSPATIGALGYLIALKHNLPLSCTFHTNVGDFAQSFVKKEVLAHESSNPFYNGLIKNDFLIKGFAKSINYLAWNLIKNFHLAVPNTTVPARFCKKLLRDKGVKNEIFVINNPVSPTKSKKDYSKKYNLKNKMPIIHVGRISAEKRIDVFIRVIANLKKSIPNILGIICSDGLIKSDLMNMAKKLKAENNILFTGFVKRDELSWLYENSRIVTAFGLYETFNLCAAEGLFYGKPLVLSDSGPHPELINGNGFLIEPNNNEVKGFSEKISLLLNDDSLRNNMGKKSRAHWKNYEYKSLINKHEKYFIESMNRNLISNKNYVNFIKYLAVLGISMNTLLLSLSLKEKKDMGLIEEFEKFSSSMNEEVKKLKKSF